jgi:hypothetical protein
MTKIDHRHQALLDGSAQCTHGKPSTYDTYGCRCNECTEAHRRRVSEGRESRTERLKGNPALAKHGKRSTYINWGCRCPSCTEAHSKQCKIHYERQKLKA